MELTFRCRTCIAVLVLLSIVTCQVCHTPQDNDRFDCHPGPDASEAACIARGCCWNDPLAESNSAVPMCYFPRRYSSYRVTMTEKMNFGHRYTIEKNIKSFLPDEIAKLYVDIIYISGPLLRIRITDPANKRFEVPFVYTKPVGAESIDKNFNVLVDSDPFNLKIVHKITGNIIIDTSVAPILYADQFIQFSSSLPSYFVYGLGEHRNPLRLTTSWQTLSFWNRDQAPILNHNLYGNNPFTMFMDEIGNANGLFLLNANAMDVVLQPKPAITFRTIGGIIDLFVYAGPTPEDVIQQHWSIISPPYFQPMWAMGFHLNRYGYQDINDLRTVMNRMKATKFPYDTQWTDIDAMDRKLVFTFDNVKWKGLPELVKELHENDIRYTPINDPCIGSLERPGTYPALDDGIIKDIFIKHDNGTLLTAEVWPGHCYMPDFTNPRAFEWWKHQIDVFNRTAPFDGLWIDMNEPASFVHGAVGGCSNTKLNVPWYIPHVIDRSLMSKTLCPSSKQYMGTQYDLHSLYGLIEAKVSMEVLEDLHPTKRHFILTRAHFSGTGRWSAHWTGDNFARWDDLYYTIPDAIVFNMFGLSFVGPDICGFFEDTTEELCMRWMQLGAFMPFMRNHNGIGYRPQDPAIWSEPARQVMKDALIMRYRLTPFWYTLHYQASINMHTVIQPLFYVYPKDSVARWLDTEFFIGKSILVAPVLNKGVKVLSVYLPHDEPTWYSFPELDVVTPINGYLNVPVTKDTIGLYTKSGCIIPMMTVNPDKNLMQNVRIANFTLLVTLPESGKSIQNSLYWDDGLSLRDVQNTIIDIFAYESSLMITKRKIEFPNLMMLNQITFAGIQPDSKINSVTLNGKAIQFEQNNIKLILPNINVDMNQLEPLSIQWMMSNKNHKEL